MKNFINIVFYKLYIRYDDFYQAVIITSGLILMNLFSIYLFLTTLNVLEFKNLGSNSPLDRFVIGPVIIIIFSLPIFLYLKNKNHYLIIIKEMNSLNEECTRRKNNVFWIYIIISFSFFLISIISPLLLNS